MPFHPGLEAFEGNFKIVGHGARAEKQPAPHFSDNGLSEQCNTLLQPSDNDLHPNVTMHARRRVRPPADNP